MKQAHIFIPLTALWAFVESGLGGMMHAFHLPFTGLVLGGFSILIISLLGSGEKSVFGQIVKATLIVMAVKAAVNPMTSPMAYIAVAFQGLLGAILFSVGNRNLLVSIIFGVLSMVESAVQKLLIMTLIMGKIWIKALDVYFESITSIFGLHTDTKGSEYVIGFYLALYVVWGIVLGIWMYNLPLQLDKRANFYREVVAKREVISTHSKGGINWDRLVFLLILIVGIGSYFFLKTDNAFVSALYLIIRTGCVVLIWVYAIVPMWSKIMGKWLQKQQGKYEEIGTVLAFMPRISGYVKPLYLHAGQHFKGLKKWKEFVLSLMVVSLRLGNEE